MPPRRDHHLTLVVATLTLAACSRGAGVPAADDPIFDGIDKPTVSEVLSSKRQLDTLATETTEEGKKSLAQGIAVRFVTCRTYYRRDVGWLRTGEKPAMPPKFRATRPYPAPDKDDDLERADVKAFLATNDMVGLGKWIANPAGGCGTDIPVKAGDETGPTLADAIRKTLG